MRHFFGWEIGILLTTAIAEAVVVTSIVLWGKDYGLKEPEETAVVAIALFTTIAIIEAIVMWYLWLRDEVDGKKKRRRTIDEAEENEPAKIDKNRRKSYVPPTISGSVLKQKKVTTTKDLATEDELSGALDFSISLGSPSKK